MSASRLPPLPPSVFPMPLPTVPVTELTVLPNGHFDTLRRRYGVLRGTETVIADHDKGCDICCGEYWCEWGGNLADARDVAKEAVLAAVAMWVAPDLSVDGR